MHEWVGVESGKVARGPTGTATIVALTVNSCVVLLVLSWNIIAVPGTYAKT